LAKEKRKPEKAVKAKKTSRKKGPDGKGKKPIKHLEGKNRILVIAPHGVMGDDDFTDIIAERLHEKLHCFAVINNGFRRPDEDKGEKSNLKESVLDLGRISDGEMLSKFCDKTRENQTPDNQTPHEDDFLGWVDHFVYEIIEGLGEPLLIHIHGIHSESIEKVASITEYKKKPKDLHALIGYGQRDSKKKLVFTAQKKTVEQLIKNLAAEKINAIDAPVKKVKINKKYRRYCGSEPDILNQYLNKKGIKHGQSIQIEIRGLGFRENEETARKTADSLATAIGPLAGVVAANQKAKKTEKAEAPSASAVEGAPPAWAEVRTTLSEKSEERRIRVKEIDQQDTRFRSRVSEYGVDQEKFKELMASVASEGILNNIIVRIISRKNKYQLISGFRRLAALEKVYEIQGRKSDLPEAEVPARIFSSLTDDEALRISFSENLARKDLTLWEIANYCRMIEEEHEKQGKSQGEIEKQLAEIIRKEERTVRRYLRISTITNEAIRKDLHNGKIDISIAGVLVREGFAEEDRGALHRFYNDNPMAFRPFDRTAQNLLKLKEWSDLNVKRILLIPTAKDFLSIDPDELKKRVEYFKKKRNKPISNVLRHEIKSLKKSIDKIKSTDHFALFLEGFSKKSKSLENKMTEVFKTKKMPGELTIEPSRDLDKKIVKLTVSAPATDIPKIMNVTAKELKDDFASLAKLFQKVPSPPKQQVSKEKVQINKNATIAFMIRLEELQNVLRALNKDGVATDESKAQILVRAFPNNKVQFGRINRNGLLIEKEMQVYREGSVSLFIKDIYTPIMCLKGGNSTECVISGINTPKEPEGKEGVLSINVKKISFTMDIPTYSPSVLIKYYDVHMPPKTAVRIDASNLKEALNKVLMCINPRAIRRSTKGILFKINKDNLTVVGTNRVKFFETVKPHSGVSVSEGELIVSFYTGKLLNEILQKEAGNVEISVSKSIIYFQVDDLLVIGKLIRDEKYLDYRKMFTEADNSFRVPIPRLRQMASSISTIADPEDNHRITLKSGNNLVVFQNEKGMVECHSDNIKGKVDLDVNSIYLSDLAKKMDGKLVEVRYMTGNNYITFHPDENNQRALLTIVKRRSDDKQSESKPKKAKTYGTREWAVHSVNCCNGCSHDCVYCYGKFMARRRPEGRGRIPIDKWKEEEVRQKDVDKGYRKRKGRIMFPSAHDITPSNFKACYTVLKKLLDAGNEVLVVSKPHFECIKPICDGLAKFKNSILYRFTIGAKNDGISSIWEPNAPSYKERKKCLKYAFDSGYNTSVSVEPMLDSENIDSLIKDLMPLVSDAIWVGKMNHIGRIISNNGDLKEEIRKIKESQSDDKIKAICERHKENPKIKWKESIKKVVGIPPVEKPGMDI